eukprot:UN04963
MKLKLNRYCLTKVLTENRISVKNKLQAAFINVQRNFVPFLLANKLQ